MQDAWIVCFLKSLNITDDRYLHASDDLIGGSLHDVILYYHDVLICWFISFDNFKAEYFTHHNGLILNKKTYFHQHLQSVARRHKMFKNFHSLTNFSNFLWYFVRKQPDCMSIPIAAFALTPLEWFQDSLMTHTKIILISATFISFRVWTRCYYIKVLFGQNSWINS